MAVVLLKLEVDPKGRRTLQQRYGASILDNTVLMREPFGYNMVLRRRGRFVKLGANLIDLEILPRRWVDGPILG